jgi:hypothetical protein
MKAEKRYKRDVYLGGAVLSLRRSGLHQMMGP